MNLNSIKKILIDNILFIVLSILSLSFLLLQDWIWVYLDNRWLLFYKYFNNNILTEILYSWNNWTYFWFDKVSTLGPRALNTYLSVQIDQILLIFIYFLIGYLFTYKLLNISFWKKYSMIWAMFFVFNPISIHFLNYMTFFFAYISISVIIYSFIKYLNTWRLIYLLFLLLATSIMFSYIRVAWLYLTVLLILAIYFYKYIFISIKKNIFKYILMLFVWLIASSMFIFSMLYPKLSWDNKYFAGMSNYAERNSAHAEALYNKEINEWFTDWFIFKDLIYNFWKDFQGNDIYNVYSVLFLVLI